jgi:CheY-like chemotaxis protein
VIEDDTTTVHLIQTQLSSAGYDVVICEQSESGLEMAAEIQPQAITLDLLMTPKSGWEILIQLKRDPRTMHIPVIAVTIVDHPSMGATLGSR